MSRCRLCGYPGSLADLGSVAICARPAPTAATLPLPARCGAAAPLTLPSRLPHALAAASAAMVRALIILRSCCAMTAMNWNHCLIGFRHVRSDEFRPAVLRCRNEREVAAQPIKLGDHERSAGKFAPMKCLSELRPVVSLARLNLDELSDQLLSAAIGVVGHCLALRFEPKATATLRIGAHPQIAHESPGCHLRRCLDCKTASRGSSWCCRRCC